MLQLAQGAQENEDTTVVAKSTHQPETTPGFLLSLSKERSNIPPATVTGKQLFKTPVANITNTLYGQLTGSCGKTAFWRAWI